MPHTLTADQIEKQLAFLADAPIHDDIAWQQLKQQGLPTPKDEAFHFTNLASLTTQKFATPTVGALVGRFPNNVNVTPLTSAIHTTQNNLAPLNRALWQEGICFTVGEGVTAESPIHLTALTQAGCMYHHSHQLTLDTDSRTTLIQERQRQEGAPSWLNSHTTITVAEGAHLTHIIYGDAPAFTTARTDINLAESATYEAFVLQTGSTIGRQEIHVNLLGENAHASIQGLNLAATGNHLDIYTPVTHKVPHTSCNISIRNVVKADAHAVFQGCFHVVEEAQKTDAQMLCQSLLLSDTARASHKPELEIFADDVQCTHGATVGGLDEEALFYLKTRGIPKQEARAILTEAFIIEHVGNLCEKLSNPELEENLRQTVQEWMAA